MFFNVIKKIWSRYNVYILRAKNHKVNIGHNIFLPRRFKIVNSSGRSDHIISFGNNCFLNCSIFFEKDSISNVLVGNDVYLGSGVSIYCTEKVEIGNNVTVAWDVVFYDHNSHPLDFMKRRQVVSNFVENYKGNSADCNVDWTDVKSGSIVVGNDVWIGFGCIILKDTVIGDRSIISAGSVVRGRFPSDVIIAGNPAVVVGEVKQK
jgi:acetyltransferase-like isoleucine patch superfamily enzyme